MSDPEFQKMGIMALEWSRNDSLIVNENFRLLENALEIDLEMINCGTYPGDATGDQLRDAMLKINRNFQKIEDVLTQVK